jgi:hypothetical protein
MADIINAVKELFATLHEAWLKSPLAFVIIIITCLLLYITIDNNNILSNPPDSPALEQERFLRVVQLNEEIPNRLEVLRNDIKADRILIRQFHNGRKGITGIPFMFIQTTYAVSAPGQGLTDQESWMSYPVSTMSQTLNRMFIVPKGVEPKCVRFAVDDIPDEMYEAYLKRYKVIQSVMCPLIDDKGMVVGIIEATSTTENREFPSPHPSLESKISSTGRVAVDKLSTIDNIGEKKSWWQFWK